MKVSDTNAVMMVALRRDGTPGTGEARPCRVCKKPMIEFGTSPGLRRIAPRLKDRQVVCTNTSWKGAIPCPGALAAKPILDALTDL